MNELTPVERLKRDLKRAAATLTVQEARFLVDAYYSWQEDRKRADNQVRALNEGDEPHEVLRWLAEQSDTLENEVKKALGVFADAHIVGPWLNEVHGIGPVISAGLIAHIDIAKAPTAGHIWRYAGLDPTQVWSKGSKRPWNASLKVLAWKAGQSFMKFSGNEKCYYGQIYKQRKEYEVARNESMQNAAKAAEILAGKKFDRSTDAFKHLSGGKLPPAQIDGRARRYAVKMFISHLQTVWWFAANGVLPPNPFPIAHMGHAHIILPPHIEVVPGLQEALLKHWGKQP
jgi:hypothetical protein